MDSLNTSCYRMELLTFESGLFDSCTDMTYVLTMENSTRHDDFMKQLNEHKPASKVIIQYNKGYDRCTKNSKVTDAAYDLTDAYRNVFQHARENNFKNVLVFEDDFFMGKYVQSDIDEICDFISSKPFSVYNLGTRLCMGKLLDVFGDRGKKHYKCTNSVMSHAVIYNQTYMNDFIEKAKEGKIHEADQFWNKSKYTVYTYHKPIAFQLCILTQNQISTRQRQGALAAFVGQKTIDVMRLDVSHEHFKTTRDFARYSPGIMLVLHILVIFIVLVIVFGLCVNNKQVIVSNE